MAGPMPLAVGYFAAHPEVSEIFLQKGLYVPRDFRDGKYVVGIKKMHKKIYPKSLILHHIISNNRGEHKGDVSWPE